MKRILLFSLVLLAGSTRAMAQQTVANGDFETWRINGAAVESPQDWLNTEEFISDISGMPFPATNTVLKTTDSHSGTYAAKLQTTLVGTNPMAGMMVLGTRVVPSGSALGGKPFAGRPTSMDFYYKTAGSTPFADDSASVTVTLTKWTNGVTETIAGGNIYITQASLNYTSASVPLNYQSTATPDSVHIMVVSGSGRTIVAGTTLFLDDITMSTTVTATSAAQKFAALTVFPNPSVSGLFTLQASQQPGLLHSALVVTDVTGRVVLQAPALATTGLEQRVVDLRGQPAGVYSLRLLSKEGTAVRPLVVQ